MKRKLALLVSSIIAVTGCNESGDNLKSLPTSNIKNNADYVKSAPLSGITDSSAYNDYGLHDPSIVKVDGTYYLFGSHLAAAKSSDLMTWTEVSSISANNLVDESPLFDTYTSEIAEGIAWTDGFTGNWAADVIESPNGKFWFYYNHCGQDNPDTPEFDEVCWNRSYLGLAVADNIEGPYEDQGIFIRSGYREGELEMYPVEGITAYNQAVHPNAIDPAAFYDKDGNLWMVYGSYSGGIFILAMDETTGMPEPGQGYGKHLVGGDFNAIEGSFVIYSPESGYYYLFWSNGGFDDEGGYNIRVARSTTPDGPYLDAAGNDVVNARVNNNMGVKLMGGFNFDSPLGELATEWGYRSPGHNSALYDEELDKHLLFLHTRFPADQQPHANAHAVRVHEMWVNEDGWLVASPERFAPIEGENYVDPLDIEGDYRLILQGNDTNTEVKQSVYIRLTQAGHIFKGNVSGEYTGSYEIHESDSYITLNLEGVSYKGLIKWQWNTGDERLEPVISAMNAAGEMVWAQQLEEKSSAQLIDDIRTAMADYFPSENALLEGGALALSSKGPRGAVITWSSSNEYLIRRTGQIYQGAADSGDQTVTMTAHVSYRGNEADISESVTVKALEAINLETLAALPLRAHFSFDDTLAEAGTLIDDSITFNDGVAATNVAGDIATAKYVDGQVGRAVNLDGTFGVLLDPRIIDGDEYTVSFWLNQQQNLSFRPALFSARSPDRWQSFLPTSWNNGLMMWSHWLEDDGSFPWFDGTTSVVPYPINEWHHVAYTYNAGSLKIFYDGRLVGSAEGLEDMHSDKPDGSIITLGLNYWDPAIIAQFDELKIYDKALTVEEISAKEFHRVQSDAEMLTLAADALTIPGDLSFVTTDLPMAGTGMFASSISWSSSMPGIIDQFGYVTRPERGNDDVEVTLTATLSLAGQSVSKAFVAKVIAEGPPRPIARFSFEGNLADSTGSFADAQPIAPGLVATQELMVYDTGIIGDAFSVAGGSSAGAKLPNNLITDHTYAFALWLKPNAVTQFTTSFFGYAANNSWMSVVPFGPGEGNTMLWSGESWFDGDTGLQIPLGEWTHFAASVDNGNLTLYINGEVVAELSSFPDVFTPANPSQFSIGVNLFSQDASFNGLMDELVIYAEPLEQADIQALFEEASSGE